MLSEKKQNKADILGCFVVILRKGVHESLLKALRGARTYVRTNERKISPFFRTLSPIGAAAQKSITDGLTDWRTDEWTGG